MKKKLLSVLLSTAMVASLLVGCGGTEEAAPAETTETTEEAPAEETEEVVEETEPETTEAVEVAATFEAPSTEGWDESMKILHTKTSLCRMESLLLLYVPNPGNWQLPAYAITILAETAFGQNILQKAQSLPSIVITISLPISVLPPV